MPKRLLGPTAAARYCGIPRGEFHDIRAAGNGPRVWNPGGGRKHPLFAVSVLDEWMHERSDVDPAKKAS